MYFFKLKKYWLHVFFLIILGMMLIFPGKGKKTYMGNVSTDNLITIPGITDKREINMSFFLQKKNVCGLKIYFHTEKNCTNGTIFYTVTGDGKNILAQGEWKVTELLSKNEEEIQAVSLDFDEPAAIEEKLDIKLTGQGIDKNSVIALYGNDQVSSEVKIESKTVYNNASPLYQIECSEKAWPYLWDFLLLWLFISVIWILRQKQGDEY